MFVIFDDSQEYVAYGDTLDEVIAEWEDGCAPIDYKRVTVVQGVEKKFEINLVDVKPKATPKPAAKKPATKSVAKK